MNEKFIIVIVILIIIKIILIFGNKIFKYLFSFLCIVLNFDLVLEILS